MTSSAKRQYCVHITESGIPICAAIQWCNSPIFSRWQHIVRNFHQFGSSGLPSPKNHFRTLDSIKPISVFVKKVILHFNGFQQVFGNICVAMISLYDRSLLNPLSQGCAALGKVKERAKLKCSVSRLVCILSSKPEKLVSTLHIPSVYMLPETFPGAKQITAARLTRIKAPLETVSKRPLQTGYDLEIRDSA